jgi:transcriptional regulator with XRE-family HTH domain
MAGPRFSPRTFRSWHLGRELRKFREAAGWEAKQVGQALSCSASRISRIESGEIKPSRQDVEELLDLYEVPAGDQHRQALQELAEGLRERGWWQQFDAPVSSYRTLIALEAEADTERCVELVRIPGLLQTRGYAHLIISTGPDRLGERAVQELVEVRMKRQAAVLSREPHPLVLDAIIGEAALRDMASFGQVAVDQLQHLAATAALPHVTVRILPFRAGSHGASLGSHTVLQHSELSMGSTETLSGHLFDDRQVAVDRFTLTMDHLTERCLSPEDSAAFIRQAVHDL